jgi:hypothetical protein
MVDIKDISKNSEFRQLPNGYSYKILDLDWDGTLCTVDFEMKNDELKSKDHIEHEDEIDNIINDILNFDYFVKMKIDKYNPDYSLMEKGKNVYKLNFKTEEKNINQGS